MKLLPLYSLAILLNWGYHGAMADDKNNEEEVTTTAAAATSSSSSLSSNNNKAGLRGSAFASKLQSVADIQSEMKAAETSQHNISSNPNNDGRELSKARRLPMTIPNNGIYSIEFTHSYASDFYVDFVYPQSELNLNWYIDFVHSSHPVDDPNSPAAYRECLNNYPNNARY